MRTLLATFTVLGAASLASANLIVYDGFNYDATGNPPLGTGPSNSAGSFGNWVYQGNNTVEPRVTAGSLSYPGLPTPVGNSIKLDNNNGSATGSDAARLYLGTLDKATDPTLYYSFILNVPTATATAGTGGAFLAGFDSNTTGNPYTTYAGLFIRQDATDTSKVDLGISTSGSANKVFAATPYATGTSLFVVGSFTFQGLANLDVFADPAAIPAAEPGTHTATTSGVDSSAATQLTNFYLRGNSGQSQGLNIDELRIGTAWDDVTPSASPAPEPASAVVLLGSAAAALLTGRRRRAQRSE